MWLLFRFELFSVRRFGVTKKRVGVGEVRRKLAAKRDRRMRDGVN